MTFEPIYAYEPDAEDFPSRCRRQNCKGYVEDSVDEDGDRNGYACCNNCGLVQ